MTECAFRWNEPSTTPPKDDMGYNGPHQCTKPATHTTNITDDDHRCCCGATLWEDR